MTVVFAVHASLTLALVLLLVAALVAAPFAVRRPPVPEIPGRAWVWAAGAVLGLLLWHVAGEIGGDGLFHLARTRKLVELGDLHLAIGERVRRRRAPPRLRVPALAGVPGADREGRLRRPVEGRAARGNRARTARRARGLRGGLRALPAGRARCCLGRRGCRDRGDGGRARRLVHLAGAARDLLAPAPRPGRPRPRLRRRAGADEGSPRERRRRVARARRRPPDLRDLPLDPLCRLPRRALGVAVREVRQRLPHPRRARRAGRALPRLAPARRPQDGVGQPRRARARARVRALRRPARTARPTSSGSRPRCSAAPARSLSPRCS